MNTLNEADRKHAVLLGRLYAEHDYSVNALRGAYRIREGATDYQRAVLTVAVESFHETQRTMREAREARPLRDAYVPERHATAAGGYFSTLVVT